MEKFIRTFKTRDDGKTLEVVLNVDVEGIIAQLACRARRSKAKRSAFMDGKVELFITRTLA